MRKTSNKSIVILLLLILITSSFTMAYADETENFLKAIVSKTKVILDGREILNEVIVIENTQYLPLKQISELMGVEMHFNQPNNTIEVRNNESDTIFTTLATGKFVGYVNFTYDNGAVYKGGYKDGTFNGKGKIIYADGTIYEGNFINGQLEGFGKYTAINGDKYEGQFKNNEYGGYGKYTYSDGDIIQAEFKGNEIVSSDVNYKIKSSGELEQVGGSSWDRPIEAVEIYRKTFLPYKYNGTVDITFSNGDHYKGEVTDDFFNGKGKITYQNGSIYDGSWVKNRKTGYGAFTYSNGAVYKGYFLRDKFNGQGTFYHTNGDKYQGAWENGLKHGYGRYTEANGNYFKGNWKNDSKHTLDEKDDKDFIGYGTYVIDRKNTSNYKTKTYKQKWDEGTLIREKLDD